MTDPNPGESALKKVQAYVETVKSTEYNLNVVAGTKSYDNGLERTLKELQEQCRLEEARSKRVGGLHEFLYNGSL